MSETISLFVRGQHLNAVQVAYHLSSYFEPPLRWEEGQWRDGQRVGRYDGHELAVQRVHRPLPRSENPFLGEDDEDPYANIPQHRFDVEIVVYDLRRDLRGGREAWLEHLWTQLRTWLDDMRPDELLMLSNHSEELGAWTREVDTAEVSVEAHPLVYPRQEEEVRLIEMVLPINIENIPTGGDNLGSSFDDARRLLGFKRAVGRPLAELVEALELVVELGVALFRRGRFRPDQQVSLTIAGTPMELPGACTYYNSAPRWMAAVGAAMVLRYTQALDELCRFEVGDFIGGYDGWYDVYAEGVILWRADEAARAEALLANAAHLAADADVMPKAAERVGRPLAEVARAVVRRDLQAFDRHLLSGLRGYREVHLTSPGNHEGSEVVPLAFLGWVAAAHDLGLPCRVRSDYLPPALVDGSFRDPG